MLDRNINLQTPSTPYGLPYYPSTTCYVLTKSKAKVNIEFPTRPRAENCKGAKEKCTFFLHSSHCGCRRPSVIEVKLFFCSKTSEEPLSELLKPLQTQCTFFNGHRIWHDWKPWIWTNNKNFGSQSKEESFLKIRIWPTAYD